MESFAWLQETLISPEIIIKSVYYSNQQRKF